MFGFGVFLLWVVIIAFVIYSNSTANGMLLWIPIIATIGWYRNSKSSKKEAFQALPKEGADEGER